LFWGTGLATLLLHLYVMEESGRKYVRDMPWPLPAECNMITNKQTAPAKMTLHVAQLIVTGFSDSIPQESLHMGAMSSYGLRVNIGTMLSIAHGGYRAWAHGEMANMWVLATAQSDDLRGDTMKYYGSMQPSSSVQVPSGLDETVSAHNWPVRLSGFYTAFPVATIIIS